MPAKGQERDVTTVSDLWTRHLAPGETLVWSASASPALRKADANRSRMLFGLAGVAALVIALLLGIRFIDSLMIVTAEPSLLAAFTPLYLVFAVAMFALALWGFRRMAVKPPAATHFAVTQRRLIALDATGAIIEELPGSDVDGVIAGGRRNTPDVYVLRRDDPKEERVFAMEHLARPLEAKAIIEDTFPQPGSEA
jgi:hypothetical protein